MRVSENSVVSIKNKSLLRHRRGRRPGAGASGVIIAQGGRFGGWALYAKDGKAKFCYNVLGIQDFTIKAEAAIPGGSHQVRMEFAYDGGGLAKGGDVTLYYDGKPVGAGRVEQHPADDLLRRRDHRHRLRIRLTSVTRLRSTGSRFTGEIHWVQIDLGDDDHDHHIDPEERFRIAMARQ